MSDKVFNPLLALKLQFEDVVAAFTSHLPKYVDAIEQNLKERGFKTTAEVITKARAAFEKIPKNLIETVGGIIQIPRGILPKGSLGDALYDYANEALDEIFRTIGDKDVDGAKADGSKPTANPTPPAQTASHTQLDLWKQLHADMLEEYSLIDFAGNGQPHPYQILWEKFVELTTADPGLRLKFLEAFHGQGTYEQFKWLVLDCPYTEWSRCIDLLLGPKLPQPTASALEALKRKWAKELAEWDKAIKGINVWLARANREGEEANRRRRREADRQKAVYYGLIPDTAHASELDRLRTEFADEIALHQQAPPTFQSRTKPWIRAVVITVLLLGTIYLIGNIS